MRILSIRSFLFIMIALMLSAAICSCSREEEPEEQKEELEDKKVEDWENEDINGDATMESGPMRFFIGSVGEVTRSSTTYAGVCNLLEDDLVAVGITRSGESEDVKLYKVLSTGYLEYAGSGEPFLWKSQNEQVSIRAWSYGSSIQTSNTLTPPESYDYSLETDQQTNGYNELLYCKAMNKKCSDGTITFTFYHQLARVVFNVTHERTGTLSVNSSSIGNTTSFPITARFSVPTGSSNYGTWVTKTTYNSITPKTETTQSGFQKTYSAVIFPKKYTQNTQLFSLTSNSLNYTYEISDADGQDLLVGNQYNYTIQVRDGLFRRNPLWYVAPYNMLTSTTMATSDNAGNYFNWSTAMNYFAAQSTSYSTYKTAGKTIGGVKYHLPVAGEWKSIMPCTVNTDGSFNNFVSSSSRSAYKSAFNTAIFGCNATTKEGISESSFFVYASETERHAIRFLGTNYCSAWKYEWLGEGISDSPLYLRISATIIEKVANSSSAASAWYNNNWSSIFWGNNESIGATQRQFYSRGYTLTNNLSNGFSTVPDVGPYNNLVNTSATLESTNTWMWALLIEGITSNRIGMYECDTRLGRTIRLFKDN